MHLVEAGEQERPRLGREPVPQLLADLLAQMAQRHHDLQSVAPGDPLEHVDDTRRGWSPTGANGQSSSSCAAGRGNTTPRRTDATSARIASIRAWSPASRTRAVASRKRLAFAHGEVVVDGVGEPHGSRLYASAARSTPDSRIWRPRPTSRVFGAARATGVPDVTVVPISARAFARYDRLGRCASTSSTERMSSSASIWRPGPAISTTTGSRSARPGRSSRRC